MGARVWLDVGSQDWDGQPKLGYIREVKIRMGGRRLARFGKSGLALAAGSWLHQGNQDVEPKPG